MDFQLLQIKHVDGARYVDAGVGVGSLRGVQQCTSQPVLDAVQALRDAVCGELNGTLSIQVGVVSTVSSMPLPPVDAVLSPAPVTTSPPTQG